MIHCILYFDIAGVAADLISAERWDVNQGKSEGLTSPMWAARRGHEEVVKLLLQQKHAQPDNMPDTEHSRVALSWAAESGNEGVVRIFLGPLFANPHGVVKLLLEPREVSPDKRDNDCRAPLSLAAKNGNDRVVKLLLGRKDVIPDRPDNGSRTPLSLDVGDGRVGTVELLLERGVVGHDREDNYGRSLLLFAIIPYMGIVE